VRLAREAVRNVGSEIKLTLPIATNPYSMCEQLPEHKTNLITLVEKKIGARDTPTLLPYWLIIGEFNCQHRTSHPA
jgi:hypothetical protein